MKFVFDITVGLSGPGVPNRIPMTDLSGNFTGSLAGNFLTFVHEICNVFSLEYDMDVTNSDFISSHVYSVEFEGEFNCQLNFILNITDVREDWKLNYVKYEDLTYTSFVDACELSSIVSNKLNSILKTVA